jgi:6-phosphogluconolactonase
MNDADTSDTQPSAPTGEHPDPAVRPAGDVPSEVVHVDVYENPRLLAAAVAETVVRAATRAVVQEGSFLLCLTGGRTPVTAYELLATANLAGQISWVNTHVFFGDERCVPPDHESSNFRMAQQTLLGRLPHLPDDHVHRIRGEVDPESAAQAYQATLRSVLGTSITGQPARSFDLLLLGMGADGHTASLFPFSEDDPHEWVSARRHPTDGSWRVTLTPFVLNTSRSVRFLVCGADKSSRLAEALTRPLRPSALPVQRIRPAGDLGWMVDRAAAGALLAAGRTEYAPEVEVQMHGSSS